MSIHRTAICVAAIALLAAFLAFPAFAEGPAAKVTDLAWMTGTHSGALGGAGTIQEIWSAPDAGNISALVRGAANGANNMVELIVIEEKEGSLELHIQQWNPGYVPLPNGPATMKLVEIGENMVKFEGVSEGAFKYLGYSKPDAGSFVISITTPTGQSFDLPLKTQ